MWSFLDIFVSCTVFFGSLFDHLGRWGLVSCLLDDLVDLTSKEKIDTVANWWTQWVSSTGVEHIEDDLDVLIKVVGVLHTLVGFLSFYYLFFQYKRKMKEFGIKTVLYHVGPG